MTYSVVYADSRAPVARRRTERAALAVIERRPAGALLVIVNEEPKSGREPGVAWQGTARLGAAWQGKVLAYAAASEFARQRGGAFSLDGALNGIGMTIDRPRPEIRQGVVITGENGVGKTGLACAAANALIAEGSPVLFYRLSDLIKDMQDAYKNADEPQGLRLETVASAATLIVDEFDTRRSDDRMEILETIIRRRDMSALGTLVTTNLPTPDAMSERWGKRIGDVLASFHWVRLGGAKLRRTGEEVYEL